MKRVNKQDLQNSLSDKIIKGIKNINWMPQNIKTETEVKCWVKTLSINCLRLLNN